MSSETTAPPQISPRVASLRRLHLLDTPPEEAFDRLTRLAARLLRAPISLVNLIDEDRQFFKSAVGLGEPWASRREMPMEYSYCQHALATRETLVIEDARQHPLVRNSPAVTENESLAYLGVPLLAAGQVLGTLCVVDTRPRQWSEEEIQMLRDLAAGAQTEIELRMAAADQSQLAALVESSTDAILTADLEGIITGWNAAAERLFGYRAAEALGQPLSMLAPPTRSDEPQRIAAAVRSGAEVGRVETLRARKDGRHVDVALTVSPIHGAAGEVVGSSVIARDITERKKQDRALLASEERFRSALENAPIGMALVRLDGRWLMSNRALSEIVGYSGEELFRLTFQEITHPEDLEADLAQVGRLLAGEISSYQMQKRYIHKEGHAVWIQLTGSLVRSDEGEPLYFIAQVQDITGRKQAEEEIRRAEDALRASEEKYRALYEENPSMLFSVSAEGVVRSVNRFGAEALGHTPGELIGRSVLGVFHEEDRSAAREHVLRVLEYPEETFQWELRKVRKDGSLLWVRETARAVVAPDGERLAFVVCEDITERRNAEQALQEREEYFRALTENSNDIITVLDADGTIRYESASVERVLGWRPEELEGRSVFDFVHPEDLAALADAFGERLQNPQDRGSVEFRYRNRHGGWQVLEARGNNQLENPAIRGLVANSRDVTERTQMERALRETNETLETLVESSPLAVITMDLEGRVTHWSPAAERIFGWRTEEVLDGPIPYVPEQRRADHESVRSRVLAGETLRGVEMQRSRKDGSAAWISFSAALLHGPDGEPRGILAMGEDVTERREQETQLRRAERLASLPTLIGGVAHELNNPLTAVKNFAELLLMDERPDEDREALEVIRREADRAARVVGDLRQLIRSVRGEEGGEAGRAADLNEVVGQVVRLREYSLRTHNIEVRQDLASSLPPVSVSAHQMEQVVLNLVTNAEQALNQKEGERLLIIRTRQSSKGVSLQVIDNGPGIRPEHLAQIFDAFFTTNAPGQGMGLGLSLVHTIVTNLRGDIRVDSEPGRGAAFILDLPQMSPAAAPASSETVPKGSGARILVVDDEAAVRRSLQRLLERLGYTVDTAGDGGAALRKIESDEYLVVLSDLRMPGMDGRALLEHLRRKSPGLIQRLAFITGDVETPDVAEFIQTTDVPVLLKPFELTEIALLVERLRRGGS